jgi:mannose-6-phosphate isomerase-like protein (cupin superfamily)
MIEEVVLDGTLYALIIRREFHQPGVHFFTPGSYSQQLGFICHPAGHRIPAHVHREVKRDVFLTQEVLLLRKGRLRVDFYDTDRQRVDSRTLEAGDVILLASGGHGFEVLEACEMIEVKQGPYLGDADKIVFPQDVAP